MQWEVKIANVEKIAVCNAKYFCHFAAQSGKAKTVDRVAIFLCLLFCAVFFVPLSH
jgi:hypothetical protein